MWEHKDFLILFAAGNDGSDGNRDGVVDEGSLTPPGTAKNCHHRRRGRVGARRRRLPDGPTASFGRPTIRPTR